MKRSLTITKVTVIVLVNFRNMGKVFFEKDSTDFIVVMSVSSSAKKEDTQHHPKEGAEENHTNDGRQRTRQRRVNSSPLAVIFSRCGSASSLLLPVGCHPCFSACGPCSYSAYHSFFFCFWLVASFCFSLPLLFEGFQFFLFVTYFFLGVVFLSLLVAPSSSSPRCLCIASPWVALVGWWLGGLGDERS